MEFVEGGLYWHPTDGYVECVQKIDDIAKFERLIKESDGTRRQSVALDGSNDYLNANRKMMDNSIEKAQKQQDYYEQCAAESRRYIELLMYGQWENVEEEK